MCLTASDSVTCNCAQTKQPSKSYGGNIKLGLWQVSQRGASGLVKPRRSQNIVKTKVRGIQGVGSKGKLVTAKGHVHLWLSLGG